MKRTYITLLLAAVAMCTFAAAPNGSGIYYQNANGKKGAQLKTELRKIIYNRTEKIYDYLWTFFNIYDVRSDGKIWDMYSNTTNYEPGGSAQGANYQGEGDSYNREHSFPKSWFGGEVKPMYTDIHHMYPTDGFVNNQRANYPFGEVSSPTYFSANGFSKLGPCSYSGYTGTVFEPNDIYKGAFARTYFYMVTCYEEKLADWYARNADGVRATIDGSTYPAFTTWQLNMLLKWAKNDPVSEKEVNRNNAVAGIQGNRNPFIDYPGLEQYIWGSKTDVAFSYDNYDGSGSGDDPGPGPDPGDDSNYFVRITSMNDLESGGTYLIVYENGSKAFNGALTTLDVAENNISVTISDHKIEATQTVMASTFTITAKTGGYSVKSASGKYIGNANQSSNGLSSLDTDSYTNIIEFQTSTGNVFIKCNSTRLNFNPQAGQSRFRYYSGGLQEIQLYKLIESTNPSLTSSDLALTGAPIALTFDLSNNTSAQTVSYTTSSTGAVTVSGGAGYVTTSVNESTKTITVTPVAKTTSAQTITVSQAADETYEAGSVTFTVTVGDSTPVPSSGGWIETSLADLTASDVFVIVGNNGNNYALPNDGGTFKTPAAVAISIADGKITSEVADNLKWNVSGNATDGYIFYPNGSSTTWLLCNDKNDGVRVGSTNNNRLFKMISGYLQNVGTSRYVGIYNSQDWRCYTSITGSSNIKGQTFAFYKYVAPSAPTSIPVFVSELGCGTFASDYALDFSNSEIRAFYATESGDNLIFHKVEKVPADTGVLLYKVGGASDDIPVYNGTTDAVTGNAFVRGTGAAVSYTDNDKNYNNYILFDGSDGLGFYKANNNPVATNRAYIQVPASTNVKCFLLDLENDPTGIRSMEEERGMMEDGVIFNLAGQRLQKMQKGINIVNGKKVLR